MSNTLQCITALKTLFEDLNSKFNDLNTNLCSRIEACIRNNAGVIDAITDLINSLLPTPQTPFTCADVASCIRNNADVRAALDARLGANTNLLNAWLNGANFLPGAGVRDKIANAKFSGLSDGDYVIKKIGGVYNLVANTPTQNTSDCTPVAGGSNRATVTKSITDKIYPGAFGGTYTGSALQFTLQKSGTFNVGAVVNYYSNSGGSQAFYIWRRIGTNAGIAGVISPTVTSLPSTGETYCQGFFGTSSGTNSVSVGGTITGNIGDVFEIAFDKDTGSSSNYVYGGNYPVTLSYDCSTTGIFN